MKIKKIEIKNFKAISEQEISFDGCSAIITGANDSGKSSLLRGLIDRFRGEIPKQIVKEGEEKGFNIVEFTDGNRVEWKFTEKTETFTYITKEGIKMTQGVLKGIGEKYFGIKFDIDKFLQSGPKEQTKMFQKLVGLDFEEIDNRYKEAYDKRTLANSRLRDLREIIKPEEVQKPNIEVLEKELQEIKNRNSDLKKKWLIENKKNYNDTDLFNKEQQQKAIKIDNLDIVYNNIARLLDGDFRSVLYECFDFNKANQIIENLPKPKPFKDLKNLPEPEYESEIMISEGIKKANEEMRLYDSYKNLLGQYEGFIEQRKQAKQNAEICDKAVKDIENEKRKMITGAKLPKEFDVNSDGITYKGFALTDNQISSSGKYIAALKLGSMVLGSLKTMHFDASFLDKNSLQEIQVWAEKNELQLLIERPDFEAGEIKYEIINNK